MPKRPRLRWVPDARVLRREGLVVVAHDVAQAGGALDEPVLLVDPDRGQRGRQAHRMAAVGQPAVEHLRVEGLGDVVAHGHRAEREVAGGEPLGHRQQVGHDAPVIDGEPAAGPPEAGHDLVGDHEDPVPVADLAHALQVAVGRDQDPVRADDRLQEDGRDRVRPLVLDDVLEALQALGHRPRVPLPPAVRVGVADHAVDRGLVGPAPRVAGQGVGPERRTVVAAVAGQDLRPAGEVAGELDGVLDRLRAAEREEDLVQVAGQDLRQLRAEAGPDLGHEGRLDVLELRRLGADGVDDAAVAVADVDRHELAVEVEDPAPLGRVQVDALRAVDRHGVHGALDGPAEERVGAGEADDLLARHPGSRTDAHRSPRAGRPCEQRGGITPQRSGQGTPRSVPGPAGRPRHSRGPPPGVAFRPISAGPHGGRPRRRRDPSPEVTPCRESSEARSCRLAGPATRSR